MRAVQAAENKDKLAADEQLWRGPESERVRQRSVR
jgi:hypothetical protein